MAGSPPFKAVMGRQRFSASRRGTSEQALGLAFRGSMNQLLGNFAGFIRAVEDTMPDVLVESLKPTMAKSLQQVPRRTGDLADSAYLEKKVTARGAAVEMGYGRSGQPDYAIYVHEMPFKHAAPTKSRFLLDPLEEDLPEIPQRIAALTRGKFGT